MLKLHPFDVALNPSGQQLLTRNIWREILLLVHMFQSTLDHVFAENPLAPKPAFAFSENRGDSSVVSFTLKTHLLLNIFFPFSPKDKLPVVVLDVGH